MMGQNVPSSYSIGEREMIFYDLLFEEMIFRPGFNTTCRLGRKHYDNLRKIIDGPENLEVMLKLTHFKDTSLMKMAKLITVEHMPFNELSLTECATNHISRTYEELSRSMLDCYDDFSIQDSYVTIIGFDVY